MSQTIKIGIAEDHLLFRQGFMALLKPINNLQVIFDVSNGVELLLALENEQPDIIFLDIEMPEMGGEEALLHLKIQYPHIKIVMLSMYFQPAYKTEYLSNGAHAFLEKTAHINKILETIYTLCPDKQNIISGSGHGAIDGASTSPVFSPPILPIKKQLSPREIEIIKLICAGHSSKEIAVKMELSKRTVDSHRFSILKKTGIKKNIALCAFARKHKLL
ncbi:MAG: response regulator transcription factor [Bacteroidia bacterium]|jgi:DNA-binding NarL/FixJ family response regulator|nr:response regulator transcription factor [Bacteroidia bacterium]